MACKKKCEVYSRIVGYFRPVQNWNVGKKEEYKHRLEFSADKACDGCLRKEVVSET